jgi:very-short-patch-repair endonuclease
MPNQNARRLRRDSTDAERRLWAVLRDRRLAGYRFRRQHPIGDYIVDFVCTKHRLIVEADGGQHADNQADEGRTRFLQAGGWRVLRFWNNDVLANSEGVVETILLALQRKIDPHPPIATRSVSPLPRCGRGVRGRLTIPPCYPPLAAPGGSSRGFRRAGIRAHRRGLPHQAPPAARAQWLGACARDFARDLRVELSSVAGEALAGGRRLLERGASNSGLLAPARLW